MSDINSPGPKLTPHASNWVNQVTDSQEPSKAEDSLPLGLLTDSMILADKADANSSIEMQHPDLPPSIQGNPQADTLNLAALTEILYEVIATYPELVEDPTKTEAEPETEEPATGEATTAQPPPSTQKPKISLVKAMADMMNLVQALFTLGEAEKGIPSDELFNLLVRLSRSPGVRKNLEKLTLIKELQDIKQNDMQSISTGERFILGEKPALALKLVRMGVMPPTIGGGPYDGMAKQAAAAGEPPYDKPVYAALAEALPVGWEELSASEIDQMIGQLQNSLSMPPAVASYSLFSTLAETSLEAAATIFKPLLKKEPELLSMMILRDELKELKKNKTEQAGTDERILLGQQPELMLQLAVLGIIPSTTEEGPYNGMAKEAANSTPPTPPYDNPVYAAMANALPSGWEGLSVEELDPVIGQLDQMIEEKMANIVLSKALKPLLNNFKDFPSTSEDIANFMTFNTLKNFFNPLLPGIEVESDKPLNEKRVARQLLESVAIMQSLNFLLAEPSSDLVQTGRKTIEQWIAQQTAEKLIGDLFGFSETMPAERNLMAQALVSYALVTTLMNNQSSLSVVMNALNNLAQDETLGVYADVARSLLNQDQIESGQVMQNIMKALAKNLKEVDEEQLLALQALIMAMIEQILGIKTEVAATSETGTPVINPTTGERPPTIADIPV